MSEQRKSIHDGWTPQPHEQPQPGDPLAAEGADVSEQLRREALRELAIAYGPTQDASLARAQLSELRKAVLDFLAAAPSTPGVVTHADYDHSRGCQYCGTGPEPNDAS